MGRFTVRIDTTNAAFEDDPAPELVRILRDIAARIETGDTYDTFRNAVDINGNVVGTWGLKPEHYYEGEVV